MKKRIRKIPLLVFLTVMAAGSIAAAAGIQSIRNTFRVQTHNVVPIESYELNKYWLPGESVQHETVLYNGGTMDAVLRVRFKEEWTNAGGEKLANAYEEGGVQKEMTEKVWGASGITNDDLWQDGGDGYYYYKKILKAEKLTGDLLKEVRLTEERICDEEGRTYASAVHNMEVIVDSMPVSTAQSERAVRKVFGNGVSVQISGNGGVNWSFGD